MNALTTRLTALADDYLRVRRALGFELADVGRVLNLFIAYLEACDADRVTIAHAVGFATAPPARTPRTQALRLSTIRCFTRWAHGQDPTIEVPPARILPARPTRTAPFIYTPEQLRALMGATDSLQPQLRAATYRTLIGLMAATGIRTGEALALNAADFDREAGALTVTGKYGKIRRLPLHVTVVAALGDYLDRPDRPIAATADPSLLLTTRGTRPHKSGVHPTFRHLAATAGLDRASSSCRPRLHDLRHTFAVDTMADAYRRGDDPALVLPILSTWLGHTEPRDTYWYLTATTELLEAAAAWLPTDEPGQS